jgi:hypothetical protein
LKSKCRKELSDCRINAEKSCLNRPEIAHETEVKVQPYQTHAVDALADSFAGQPKSGEVRRGG